MKTHKLIKLTETIKEILEQDELARKDDCYLVLKVLERTHPQEVGKTFAQVMLNAKKNKINFESIRRCRQKVQEKHQNLKDSKTAEARFEEQSEYQRFARNG